MAQYDAPKIYSQGDAKLSRNAQCSEGIPCTDGVGKRRVGTVVGRSIGSGLNRVRAWVVRRALRSARMRVLLWRCFVARRKLRTVFKIRGTLLCNRSFSLPGFKSCFTVEKDGMGEQKRKWFIR